VCGLVVSTAKSFERTANWTRALQRLECRGPDDSGQDVTSLVRLGHRRLAIIGLGSAGKQPITATDGAMSMVYNGEIYNYKELAAEVGIEPTSDTALLFELLRTQDWGRLSRLRGMYAFVFVDHSEQRLLYSRDRFGIKPLYIGYDRNGEVTLASVAAAVAEGSPTRAPNRDAVLALLAGGLIPSGVSAFEGIYKVPPGRLIELRRRAQSGWDSRVLPWRPMEWPKESLAFAVQDSVTAHMVSDEPVGVLMSGGVDSTLVALHAARQSPDIRTYTLTNPSHPHLDESQLARANAQLIGATHVEVPASSEALIREVRPLVASSGEPFSDLGYLPLSLLCRRVQEDIKVVLAGEGADEFLGGYRRYWVEYPMYRSGFARRLLRGASGVLQTLPNDWLGSNGRRTLRAWKEGPSLSAHLELMFGEVAASLRCFPEAMPGAMQMLERAWDESSSGSGLPDNRSFDLAQWLPNVFLEKSDRASMLHGVEVRVPFLDPAVAAASLNPRTWSPAKSELRKMIRQINPEIVVPRVKRGWSVAAAQLMATPTAVAAVERQLHAPDSLLRDLGLRDAEVLESCVRANPTFAFRLVTMDAWQQQWL
jgi:asparagine synthase (glutamine-hydrolysing)